MLAFTGKKLVMAAAVGATGAVGYYQWYQLKQIAGDLDDAKLDKLFSESDQDKSGTIEITELQTALDKAGVYSNAASISAMLSSADKNHDGKLSKEEFREAMLGKK